MNYDVVIAGAGPAGVSTAVALVRRDPSLARRIVVLDRATFPREKPCGGGLTGHAEEAMHALGLELAVPSVPSPRAEVRFWGYRREVTLGKPVRVIRRDDFDASLVAQARALGIEVREGAPLAGFAVDGEGVDVAIGPCRQGGVSQRLRARVLVGADGVGSRVRKSLNRESDGTPIRLFRLEVPARGAWRSDAMLYDFSPMTDGLRGYLWVFPVDGDRLNVGLMHDPGVARSGGELDALLRRHLDRLGITLPRAARGWPAFGYHPSAPIAGPRLLTVGDAAGIDALTGEGIAVGMEQALVAADAIAAALDTGDFRFRGYRRAVRRATVGRELAIDRWLARLLYRGDWQRWLSLVLCDERMLELYAARVSGTLVLADHKRELVWALWRHLFRGGERRKLLAANAVSELDALPRTKLHREIESSGENQNILSDL
ncbi:MAG: NAD(P)/FAD-dependent oxidoreductase [Polyangia bacterium]